MSMCLRLIAILFLLMVGTAATEPTTTESAKLGADRAGTLRKNVKTFVFSLNCIGDRDQRQSHLRLSVQPLAKSETKPSLHTAQITDDQAKKLIDYLASESFLDRATDTTTVDGASQQPADPHYVMRVQVSREGGAVDWQENLGWGPAMLRRLDGLRKVLEADAATSMDWLLAQLAKQREEWKKQADTRPANEWIQLNAGEKWYKSHRQPEDRFVGTLEQLKPVLSSRMRSHRYKLGDRFLYPGQSIPELEKLVGQKVEIKGKPYDVELEGQPVHEIWVGAIRPADVSAKSHP